MAGTILAAALTAGVAVAPAQAGGGRAPRHVSTAAAAPSDAPVPAPVPLVHGAVADESARLLPAPPTVTLDPSLTKPLAGDAAATRAARVDLARADDAYQLANQLYDRARADLTRTTAELAAARTVAAIAVRRAEIAHGQFVAVITAQYEGGDSTDTGFLLASGPQDVLADLEMQRLATEHTAAVLSTARTMQAAARAAQRRVAEAYAATQAAQRDADAQLGAAADALRSAQDAVARLHARDLAVAISASAHTLADAATAIQAQAIASRAASARAFAHAAGPAQVIAIADRALLEQAAGRSRRPAPLPGVPGYHATAGAPVDEQAVMGPAPDLGASVPFTGTAGTGPVLALTAFDGVVSQSGWPSAGVGMKVAGTAPLLRTDGVAVHPKLPEYRRSHRPLRAEVAVDAALATLGSPYVWDAAGPTTFDCSGLTLWAWGHAGVPLAHFTGDQLHEGRQVAANELLPGDLVLFGAALHHVGMYIGAGFMIDAPTTGDYVKIQPVADDGDFVVAVRP